MRVVAVLVALLLCLPAWSQEKQRKKPAAKPAAHKKATPEQIRKFNQLQKKQEPAR